MKRALVVLLAMSGAALAASEGAPSNFLSATRWERGAALWGDLSEGGYRGRRLEVREAGVAFAPSERWALWLGEAKSDAYGRSSGSRFELHGDQEAVRYRLGAHGRFDFAVQAERTGTGDAVATTGVSRTVYEATESGAGRLIATRGDFDGSLGLGIVHAAAGDSRSLTLSVGHRRRLGRLLSAWTQASFVEQSWSGARTSDATDVKTVLRARLVYRPFAWGSFTLGGTFFPSGMPFDEALGSFLLYEPSNPAASNLRRGAIGYGTLGLTFTARF